jgi:2-C-methyl-D-erythritol 4-phosphate cytidylyltransferase / 2-C-methyl-D-erythritol 2,4-cyclodiphosphate synthase
MRAAVVLVSAGKGTRLGANLPKAAVKVAGFTLLEHSLVNIAKFNPAQLVVVAPEELQAEFEEITAKHFEEFKVVSGGETRQQSVRNGLDQVTEEHVLVHDAARAFTPPTVFLRVLSALESAVSVVPGLAVTDTIKEVHEGLVSKTLDRSNLRAVQTPQGFNVAVLREAMSRATEDFTDEAGLLESFGHKTIVVEGDQLGFKVTTSDDLERARAVFGDIRTGVGVDAHQFSSGGELVLGGLVWPELPKLEGHSDGDSIAHAIVDALLSAANLGDIGSNFGVDKPEFKGAKGEVFIAETLKKLAAAGYVPVNVAVQVVGDKPKIGPRRDQLQEQLSNLVGAPVSVLATTTDGLGFLADARGVAAVATALVRVAG